MAAVPLNPYTIKPLTPELWPALEELFGDRGPASRCWCMYWRLGPDYRRRPSDRNKAAFRARVKDGPPPGLLAYDGDMVVGWCQLTPRDELTWLERTGRLRRLDEMPVWSLSCLYVRAGRRKQGVATALIQGALAAARQAGAPALEAYPLDAELTPSASFTGHLSTFERTGFKIVARHDPARPIVRYEFN